MYIDINKKNSLSKKMDGRMKVKVKVVVVSFDSS